MADDVRVGGVSADFTLRTEDAERRLARIKAEMQALRSSMATGAVSVDAFENEMRSLAMEADRLERSLRKAGQGAQTIQLEAPSRGMRNLGFAALETSRAVEDLQYGLHGVVNNIPGLVMALGGGAGLTAAISLTAVAANQLFKNWGSLMEALGASSPIQNATTEMERLEAITRRTADEEDRYQRLLRARQAGEAQAAGTTIGQDAQAQAVRRVIVAAPQSALIRGLQFSAPDLIRNNEIDTLRGRRDALAERVRVAEEDRENNPDNHTTRTRAHAERIRLQRVLDDLNRAEQERARDLLGQSETDPAALGRVVAAIRRTPEAFPPGVADSLEDAGGAPRREAADRTREVFGKFWADLTGAVTAEAERQAKANAGVRRVLDALDFGFGKKDQLSPEERLKREREANAAQLEIMEAEDAENLAEFRKRREDNRRKAEDVARQLLSGGMGASLIAGQAGEDDVAGAMRRAGYGEDTVGRRAGQVAEIIRDRVDEMVRERATAGGVTEDEARSALTREREVADRRAALAAAEGLDPSVRERSERMAIMGLMSGGSVAEVGQSLAEGIRSGLRAAGLSDEQAGSAADQIARQAVGDAGNAVDEYQRAAAEAMQAARKGPETFDASQLLERVQAGVGHQDQQKRLLTLNERMEAHLRRLAEREQRDIQRLS